MSIEKITYKGVEYNVIDPGNIKYVNQTFYRKGIKVTQYYILDQLSNCNKIRCIIPYLKKKYNLTEFDYYIIVALRGDISKIPTCTYINPYTNEKCDHPRKFRSLKPVKSQKTGLWDMDCFHLGCKEHIINAAAQNSQILNYKKGVTGLQKADRSSKIWRDKLRDHALKQMAEGNSIFSPDDVRKSSIPKPISHITVSGFNEICKDLGFDNSITLSKEQLILIDKESFLRKGSENDNCIYYKMTFKENNIVKYGVTININSRIKKGKYHKLTIDKYEIIYSSNRKEIAELEYKVKMKFKDYIIIGNEGFDSSIVNEIENYIKSIIN